MPAKIDTREIIEQKEIQESTNFEYSLVEVEVEDQSESEVKWIRLHQMFDK
tara:strand:- start:14 stop:166 length:153 start_codon:yes stop_codon:yes gene_type:complete